MYVKLLRSCWDDFAICAGVLAGALLLSLLPSILFSSPPLMISGLILPIVSVFLILIFSLSYFGFQFSHLVRFGSTRRRSLALTFGLAATVALFCMLLSALLTGVEGLLVSIRRDVPPNTEIFSLPLWAWFAIPLAAIAMGALCGTILHRFGKKGMWALWAIWMSVCFIPQIFNSYLDHLPDLTLPGIASGAALFLAFCWSIWYLLRAPVPE